MWIEPRLAGASVPAPIPSLWPPIVSVRRLGRRDAGLVETHYRSLSPARRVERFGRVMTDEALARHCAGLDWRQAIVLGHGGRVLLGVAELAPDARPGRLELALSLDEGPGWERVGANLAAAAIRAAREGGWEAVVVRIEAEEVRVPVSLRAAGLAIRREGDGAVIDLSDPRDAFTDA